MHNFNTFASDNHETCCNFNMRTKLTSFFLLLCLMAPLAVTTLWYQQSRRIVRKQVKQMMIRGINPGKLILLRFSHEDTSRQLRWEHAQEFEYNGNMYDIVKTTQTADSVNYLCWPDHRETALNKELNRLVDIAMGDDTENKQNNKRLIDFLQQLYPPEQTDSNLLPESGLLTITSYRKHLITRSLSIDLPPPKIV